VEVDTLAEPKAATPTPATVGQESRR
jgi:hypothetical protein